MLAEEYYITETPSLEPWMFSFYVVVALHIALVFVITFGLQFTPPKPKFENIYTIDLIELPPTFTPPPAPVVKKVEPTNKAVSIAAPQPQQPTIEATPISLKPKKKKIKKKIVEDNKTIKVDKDKAVTQRKKLAEALRIEQLAQQKAEEALKALEEERKLFESTNTATTQPTSTTGSTSTGSNRNSSQRSAVESQWLAAVNSRLLKYWALPEFKQWDPDLTAVVVVTIDKNGRIINEFFEKTSGDKVFDQFVKKTLQDASPFPTIPTAMKKQRYELGLNFKPGSII